MIVRIKPVVFVGDVQSPTHFHIIQILENHLNRPNSFDERFINYLLSIVVDVITH